jgi:carbamoyl-phosphate synthase large subunit
VPKRTDIEKILIIGSGPIVIGQASEFDYSGTQACRILRDEGYYVILANSNPATIMTDPEFADRTYIEPLSPDVVEAIVERERPDAILPTLGGQTALNMAMSLVERGTLDRLGVELIGAKEEAIKTAENRDKFKAAMGEIGLAVPESGFAYALDEACKIAEEIGFPIIIRPSFILGGQGTGIASDMEEFRRLAATGLAASPVSEILIERSIAGWKEYELELMRDHADNCVVVCSIENFDPMGVHTGDSVTVAPAQTLSDVEYQLMRDAAFACIRTRVEGDRLPDREDRRQARRRLHARRDPERHHQGHAGELRADDRLRRHQGPAMGLREVPRPAERARHPHAVRRRGDGHRPHLPRVAAEGFALTRDRSPRPQLRPGRERLRRAGR